MGIRPTRIEVNLDNIKYNIESIRKIVKKETLITAVVKSNAYGHGAIEVSKILLKNGADRLAVSTLEEGIELRKAGIKAPILLLNYVDENQESLIIKYGLIPSIYDLKTAKRLSKLGKSMGSIIKIHIKLDTGMNRIGFLPEENSLRDIEEISQLDNIQIEGIYSHLCRADESNKEFTEIQFKRFTWIIDMLKKRAIEIPIKHISNSAGIIDLPEYNLDMVRAGIILYGYYPSDQVDKSKIDLRPALELKSKLSHVKIVEKGSGIGYGHSYIAKKDIKVGTVPIGYGDGYTRLLSNKAYVNIGSRTYPNVGNICMDQFMVRLDLDSDVKAGDEILLISDKYKGIRVDDLSKAIGTINYEILCMLGRRIPRVYIENSKVKDVKDYLLD